MMKTGIKAIVLLVSLLVGFNARASSSLYFIENKGQIVDQYSRARADLDFKLSVEGALQVFVGKGKLLYQWAVVDQPSTEPSVADLMRSYRMDVALLGISPGAYIEKGTTLPYYETFYTSLLQGSRAHTFQTITYKNVYPNIDWVLYVNEEGKLEYDFKVHPGGRVADIRIQFSGATTLQVNSDGSLTATTPMGSVTEKAPVCFMEHGRPVASKFVLGEQNTLQFEVGAYEGMLIIDPVLEWGTYFGGSGSDLGRFTATDTKGFVYMTGSTASASNIATTGAHQDTFGKSGDAFLVKFDSTGARIWASYYGGAADDQGWSVACDERDNVYLVGQTASATGMGRGGHQNANGGSYDAFVAKFNTDGVLRWGTYYGGSGSDEGWGVVANKKGFIYVTGRTESKNSMATDATVHSAGMDAFLVKFDTAGLRQWGTYLGGPGAELTWAISCDHLDNVYLSGETGSASGMATPGAHQTQMTASNGSEAFIAKFRGTGSLAWCTYYGGNQSGQVFGTGIACDPSGAVIATGYTTSTVDIATPGAHQSAYAGGYDAYVVKFDSTGKRAWGTYYGGTGAENGYGIATDKKGNIFIAGYTTSKEKIATAGAFQLTPASNGSNDFYVAKLDKDGVLQWGSYYGASGYDAAFSIAHDQFRNIYVSGFSNANGMGTTGAFKPSFGGSFDGFLMRISECVISGMEAIVGTDSVCAHTGQTFSVPAIREANGYVWTLPDGWEGASNSDSIQVTVGAEGGIISVFAYNECDTTLVMAKTVSINTIDAPIISVNGFELSIQGQYATYQWLLDGKVIEGATSRILTVAENGDYIVIVTTADGCIDTSEQYAVTNVTSHVGDLYTVALSLFIYPNPATGMVYIHSTEVLKVMVSSIDGKQLMDAGYTNHIDLRSCTDGLYFLSFYRENGQFVAVKKVNLIR